MLYNFAEFVEIHKMQNLKHLLQKEELYKCHLAAQIIEFLMGIDKTFLFGLVGFFLRK